MTNEGWIPFSFLKFPSRASLDKCMELEQSGLISDMCAIPAMTSQDACCDGPADYHGFITCPNLALDVQYMINVLGLEQH